MIGAVVLAAGRSQRMGRPKMTLPWGDTTVIGQVASVLLSAKLKDVVVVTGGDREGVEGTLQHLPVRTVFNPDFENGEMLLSLQCGLTALEDEVSAALVVLGDQPQIELVVVQAVISAFVDGKHALVMPSYQMRRGHPWLVARPLWGSLFAFQPPATMRLFVRQFAGEIHYVNVDSPSILQDLDTPEDYHRFTAL
jgi:molybdenum cofactor cytidylyltransferase